MNSLFDLPIDPFRHRVPPHMRETVLVGACSPSYQQFLRRCSGRCIVVVDDHATTVIAGAVKIGKAPPISIQDFLARVQRGERPWEPPGRALPDVSTVEAQRDRELIAQFQRELEAVLDEDEDEDELSSEGRDVKRRVPLTDDERRRGLSCEKFEVIRPNGDTYTMYELK
jgi:hypothetical protein